MGGCRDGGVGTFLLCKDLIDSNAFLVVDRVRGSKEVRNRSSARRCFECLILPFLIRILGEAASCVLQKVLYHFQSKLKHSGESETGFVAEKFRVKLSDPIC